MKNNQPIEVPCACGCGRKVTPTRKWHKYFEDSCRLKAFHERQASSDLEKRVETLEERIKRLESPGRWPIKNSGQSPKSLASSDVVRGLLSDISNKKDCLEVLMSLKSGLFRSNPYKSFWMRTEQRSLRSVGKLFITLPFLPLDMRFYKNRLRRVEVGDVIKNIIFFKVVNQDYFHTLNIEEI